MGLFNIKDYLLNTVLDYVKAKADELVEKTVTKTTDIIGILIAVIFVSFSLGLFFLFTGIGVAFFISELTGKTYVGFLIMGGFYLLSGCLFWLLRRRLISNPLKRIIMKNSKRTTTSV